VLDPSLPFWADRDKWARWKAVSLHEEEGDLDPSRFTFHDSMHRLFPAPHQENEDVKQLTSLDKLMDTLMFPPGGENTGARRSVVAMYHLLRRILMKDQVIFCIMYPTPLNQNLLFQSPI
jgi:hypothetical protein